MTEDEFVVNEYVCLWLLVKWILLACIHKDMKNLLGRMCFSKVSNVLIFYLQLILNMPLPHEHYRQINMAELYLHFR